MKRIDKFLVAAAIFGCSALVFAGVLTAVQARPVLLKGDLLSVPPISGRTRSTLAIVLSSSCSACARVAPVLNRISARPRPFGVVVVGEETESTLATFATGHGILADRISAASQWIDPSKSASLMTPTVILIDEHQRVVKAWSGLSTIQAQEKAMLEMATRQASRGE
jgi:hypothetical protein